MKKNIIIIGSGIAGLTLAIALERKGYQVQLFEAASKLETIGAGIWMAPNAMKVFSELGIADEICQNGKELSFVQICDSNFKTLQLTNLASTKKEFGYSIIAIHRGRLQQVLLNNVKLAVPQCGYSLDTIETDGSRVIAKFTNGKSSEGDLLIGADGLHSRVRNVVFGDKPLRHSGLTCFRGVTQFRLPSELRESSFELWGGKNRIGFSQITDNEVYWYVTYKSKADQNFENQGIKAKLLECLSQFNSLARDLIESTESNNIIQNDLVDLEPFHPWSTQNICLIGDAAHPMTPNLGQGGAQAVLDSFYLSKALSEENNVNIAFKKFESMRSKKVDSIVKASLFSGKFAHMEFGANVRNFILQHVPNKISEESLNGIFRI